MRYLHIVILILLMGANAFAQPSSGDLILGGNLSVYNVTERSKIDGALEDDWTETFMKIAPMAGYFLSERMALGGLWE